MKNLTVRKELLYKRIRQARHLIFQLQVSLDKCQKLIDPADDEQLYSDLVHTAYGFTVDAADDMRELYVTLMQKDEKLNKQHEEAPF